GVGFLGLLLVQLATRAGAQVVALTRRQYPLDLARAMGARECLPTLMPDTARDEALRLTGWRGYERVVEAGGTQETLDLASALVAEHGRLVIAGYHQDGLRQVNLQQWNWRGIDVINAHERTRARYV